MTSLMRLTTAVVTWAGLWDLAPGLWRINSVLRRASPRIGSAAPTGGWPAGPSEASISSKDVRDGVQACQYALAEMEKWLS